MDIQLIITIGVPVLVALVICSYIKGLNKMPGTPDQANRYTSSELNLSKKSDTFSHQTVERRNKN